MGIKIVKELEVWREVRLDGRTARIKIRVPRRKRLLSVKLVSAEGDDVLEDLILEHVLGWEGVEDESDPPVSIPFDAESLKLALDCVPGFANAVMEALSQAALGKPQSPQKT